MRQSSWRFTISFRFLPLRIWAAFRKCYQLTAHTDRVRHIAPADFRAGSHLRLLLEEMVGEIALNIRARRQTSLESGTVRAPKY